MAGYEGYLIKVGNYKIPNKLIKARTFKTTNYGQDLGSYEDANGLLQRTPLTLQVPKVEFDIIPLATDDEFWKLMSNIQANFVGPKREKKASVTVYIPELHKYVTNNMYMPDISFVISFADDTELEYDSIRLAFIGYGVNTHA